MTEAIERAARAIGGFCISGTAKGWRVMNGATVYGGDHDDLPAAYSCRNEAVARAVLESLLPPSEETIRAMRIAAGVAVDADVWSAPVDFYGPIFTAAILCALGRVE